MEGFTRQFPFFLLNFNSNEMNDGMLLKFKDSYSIHITSCCSVFTDIGIRSTIKFRNGRFNKKIQVRGFRTNSVFSYIYYFKINLLWFLSKIIVLSQIYSHLFNL